jgi:hypothetical protein
MRRKYLCKVFATRSRFIVLKPRQHSPTSLSCGESELSGSAIGTRRLKMAIQGKSEGLYTVCPLAHYQSLAPALARAAAE